MKCEPWLTSYREILLAWVVRRLMTRSGLVTKSEQRLEIHKRGG